MSRLRLTSEIHIILNFNPTPPPPHHRLWPLRHQVKKNMFGRRAFGLKDKMTNILIFIRLTEAHICSLCIYILFILLWFSLICCCYNFKPYRHLLSSSHSVFYIWEVTSYSSWRRSMFQVCILGSRGSKNIYYWEKILNCLHTTWRVKNVKICMLSYKIL